MSHTRDIESRRCHTVAQLLRPECTKLLLYDFKPHCSKIKMPGTISPHCDEAGSSGHADVPKTLAVDAASSDDLVGVAQPDIQQQQETWVKYNSLQEGALHHITYPVNCMSSYSGYDQPAGLARSFSARLLVVTYTATAVDRSHCCSHCNKYRA